VVLEGHLADPRHASFVASDTMYIDKLEFFSRTTENAMHSLTNAGPGNRVSLHLFDSLTSHIMLDDRQIMLPSPEVVSEVKFEEASSPNDFWNGTIGDLTGKIVPWK